MCFFLFVLSSTVFIYLFGLISKLQLQRFYRLYKSTAPVFKLRKDCHRKKEKPQRVPQKKDPLPGQTKLQQMCPRQLLYTVHFKNLRSYIKAANLIGSWLLHDYVPAHIFLVCYNRQGTFAKDHQEHTTLQHYTKHSSSPQGTDQSTIGNRSELRAQLL